MDLTVAAIPFYFASMGAEAWYLDRRSAVEGPSPADYGSRDTVASLTMGVASLVAPLVATPVFRTFDVARGRNRKILLGVAGGAALAAVVADAVARASAQEAGTLPDTAAGTTDPTTDAGGSAGGSEGTVPTGAADPTTTDTRSRRIARAARRVAGSSAVAAIAAAGAAVTGTWAARTTGRRLYERKVLPDLGTGPLAVAAAVLGWDFIYYWNHRFMHESRYMWAIHVVHHSSQRYNLSTALRQPVADALGTFVPYGLLSLLGLRPEVIETARGINLIYQFWIHTEAIGTLGPLEGIMNTASAHRVHHGSNRQYLDRNHGSILIIWDRMFGTYEPEGERVVYGLTKNIDTFDPVRIATHEYVDIAHDVAASDSWRDRLSYVFRGPGWAYERRRPAQTASEETGMRPVAAAS